MLTFRTTESTQSVREKLQNGLDKTTRQFPWIAGRVFHTTPSPGAAPHLELRWHSDAAETPRILDSGVIQASYEVLAGSGMPPGAKPSDLWSLPGLAE